MRLFITRWARESRRKLERSLSAEDWKKIMALVLKLKDGYPSQHLELDIQASRGRCLSHGKFEDKMIHGGYKFKWRNLSQINELRLTVAIFADRDEAYLCDAYTKSRPQDEGLNMALLVDRIEMLRKSAKSFTVRELT